MARLVLVADDSPAIQKKVQGILKGEGFDVETVSNGVAAIKRLAVVQPALVLADVSMPGRDGYEVCDFVKHSAQLSHVPVLLVASDMEPYDEARGARVRADGKFKKPFEPQDLIAIVARYAASSDATQVLAESPMVAESPALVIPTAPPAVSEFEVAASEAEEPPHQEKPASPPMPLVPEGVPFIDPLLEDSPAQPQVFSAESKSAAVASEPEESVATASKVPAEVADLFVTPEEEAVSHEAKDPSSAEPAQLPKPAEEPLLIEEETAPISAQQSPSSTLVFRTPVELAEPVWHDELVPATAPTELERPWVAEPLVESAIPAPVAEISAQEHLETSFSAPPPEITHLDSFSLDDAAAGQVRFSPAQTETAVPVAAHDAPLADEILAVVPSEHETMPPAGPPADAPGEWVADLPSSKHLEAPLAAEHADAPVSSIGGLSGLTTDDGPEPSVEVPIELPAETRAAAREEWSTEALSDTPGAQIEEARVEPPLEVLPEHELAEEIHAAAPIEAPPPVETSVPPVPSTAPRGAAAGPTAIDWDLLYLIVRKIVLKMSPPAISREDAEELARRLADETAFELSAELPSHHH